MASIKDVARLAGVSAMTVSRTLNNNYPVSAQTREKVLKAVKALDYEPNIMGRNLRNARSKTVLVAGLGFVEPLLNGIYRAAAQLDYEVILMHTRHFGKQDYGRRIKNGMASGILFMNMMEEDIMAEVNRTFSMVQCGSAVNMPNACSVSIDNEAATYRLTERLLQQGCRRIALVSSGAEDIMLQMTISRRKGFLKALADNRVEVDPRFLVHCNFLRNDFIQAVQIADRFAALPPDEQPDAVICEQNQIAIACLNVFREKGLAVPQQIAVTSLDDQPINEILRPTLTAIRQPYEAMGREAMQLLVAKIEGQLNVPRQVIFKHELIWRDSTATRSKP